MSAPSDRRGFLSGLATLPLIGGAVTILGQPTRAAEPVTRELLSSYNSWLALEQRHLLHEMHGPGVCDYFEPNNAGYFYHWQPFGKPENPKPSTRAAVVLSAVGCDWRQHPRDIP